MLPSCCWCWFPRWVSDIPFGSNYGLLRKEANPPKTHWSHWWKWKKKRNLPPNTSRWWFLPIWKIFVKMGSSSPRTGWKFQKSLKPSARVDILPKKLTFWSQKWRCGSWFSFAQGWFSGSSPLVLPGVVWIQAMLFSLQRLFREPNTSFLQSIIRPPSLSQTQPNPKKHNTITNSGQLIIFHPHLHFFSNKIGTRDFSHVPKPPPKKWLPFVWEVGGVRCP